MTEESKGEGWAREVDEQFLGTFNKSYKNSYERWRRKDLFDLAVQTMPKQAKAGNLIDSLANLKAEFEKRLEQEG